MKKKLAILFVLLITSAVYAQDKLTQLKLDTGFKMFDRDKDDALDEAEFKALGEYSPKLKGKRETVDYLFRSLDTNRDGMLNRQEYLAITKIGSTRFNVTDASASMPDKSMEHDSVLNVDQLAFFEKKIRPVLVDHCYRCHSENADDIGGSLVLDTREGIRRGGSSGPGVIPGSLEKSLIVEAIRYQNKDLQMPPDKKGGKLSDAVIADFEKWVQMGAPDPRDGKAMEMKSEWDMEKAKSHWSFQTVTQPEVPEFGNPAWPKTDIDRFVLAGLAAKGITPVSDAPPVTLARRLYFDLTGLPPTPEEVDSFLIAYQNDSTLAICKLVDALLDSPHFGERWGRHWLDVARYAESTGKDVNCLLPHAWRYRDYVIESFNQDKPINDFFQEQIAGDLLPAKNERDRALKQIATGFLAVGSRSLNERNPKQMALDTADEQIDAVSQAMLGVTVACARCHDHKFDPIPQKDYYALAGIFLSTETCYGTAPTFQNAHAAPSIELPEKCGLPRMSNRLSSERRSELEKELTNTERYGALQFYGTAIKGKLTGQGLNVNNDPKKLVMFVGINAKIGEIKTELNTYQADGKQKLLAIGVRDYPVTASKNLPVKPTSISDAFEMYSGRPNQFRMINNSPLYGRGDVDKPGEYVPRGLLTLILSEKPSMPSSQSGRRELAEWLVSNENPLTSRVFVNRVWHWLFGAGLVSSVDNFGTTGQPPSNQALLDHLAMRLQHQNWSLKSLIKEIVLSRSYQLASTYDTKNFDVDPENALVWRMTPRRLDAECIRDAMLAVSGKLELKGPLGSMIAQRGDAAIGGYPIKSMRAPLGDDLFLSANANYRSVFLPVPRNAVPESLTVFDFSEPSTVNGNREVTTVPSQALFLLNNEFVSASARGLAEKIMQLAPEQRIEKAFRFALARTPSSSETKAVTQFLNEFPNRDDKSAAYVSFCRALLASAEFRSID